jgi:hypothetical protein
MIRGLDCYRTQLYGGRKWFKRDFDVGLGSERHFHGVFGDLSLEISRLKVSNHNGGAC